MSKCGSNCGCSKCKGLVIKSDTNKVSLNDVNSKIKTTAVIGAPITELDKAAIPPTTKIACSSGAVPKTGIWKIIAPTVAPKNSEGEKTPPKSPKPRHIEVRNNLNISKSTINIRMLVEVIMSSTGDIPNPKTSGMKQPTTPHNTPGIIGL